MSKRDLLKLPDDFEGNMRALLQTPPAPPGTAGSRKAIPKPKPTPKDKRRKHTMAMSRRRAALEAQATGETPKKAKRKRYAKPAATGSYEYEMAPVRSTRPKRKATKKR